MCVWVVVWSMKCMLGVLSWRVCVCSVWLSQVSRMGWVYGGMRIVCLVGRLAVQYVVFKAVMFGVWAGCLGDEQVQRGVSIWADRC